MDKLDIWHKISSGLTEAGYESRGVNSSLYSKDRVELDVYMEPSVSADAKTQETIKQMVYKILEENKFQQKAFHVTIKFLPENKQNRLVSARNFLLKCFFIGCWNTLRERNFSIFGLIRNFSVQHIIGFCRSNKFSHRAIIKAATA